MVRFWRRKTDRSVDRLLETHRPEPTDDFASSLLARLASAAPGSRGRSPRRIGIALALVIVAVALASVLGGVGAASAGMTDIFHVASRAVSPAPQTASSSGQSATNAADNSAGAQSDDSDNSQYQVGVCHWAHDHYVLIFVSPQGAANHFANHPNDKPPVNGHC